MNDSPFGFSCSPLTRNTDAPGIIASLALQTDSVGDGKGYEEYWASYGYTSALSSGGGGLATPDSNERNMMTGFDPNANAQLYTPSFPLPSVLGDDVRNPATFGLGSPICGIISGASGGGGHPPLPPLRVPDRPFTHTNDNSPSSTSGGITGNAAAYLFSATQQPPPHTYPTSTSSATTGSASLSTVSSSDQLYTPSSSTSGTSFLLPSSSAAAGFDPNTPILPTLPGLDPFPPALHQQQQQVPTTMVPTAMQQWPEHHPRSRQAHPYLEPYQGIRSSTSSLSLGRLSVSPYSRATSMESDPYLPTHHQQGKHDQLLPPPRMDVVDRQWAHVHSHSHVHAQDDEADAREIYETEDESTRQVYYTDEAETKQTKWLKRCCHNCDTRSPPSWRKSLLVPGKILCNKCGIYERTHNRPRPPQGDDLKLRKTNDPHAHSTSHSRHAAVVPHSPPTEADSASVSMSSIELSPDLSSGDDHYSSPTQGGGHHPPSVAQTPLSPTFPSPAPVAAAARALPSIRSTYRTHQSPSSPSPISPVSPHAQGQGQAQAVYGFTSSNARGQTYSPYARPSGTSGGGGRRSR